MFVTWSETTRFESYIFSITRCFYVLETALSVFHELKHTVFKTILQRNPTITGILQMRYANLIISD
jgi:hypothetical protein